MEAPKAGGVGKNCVFQLVDKSAAQTPYRRKLVVRVHDGALAEEYAVSSSTKVVVEVCLSHARLTSAYMYMALSIACSLCDS